MTALIPSTLNSYTQDLPSWSLHDRPVIVEGHESKTHKGLVRSDTGGLVAIVSDTFVPRAPAQIALDLDALAAPFGGRAVLGRAAWSSWSDDAHFAVTIKAPPSVLGSSWAEITRYDRSPRHVSIVTRGANDGTTRQTSVAALMRQICANGMTVPEGGFGGLGHKHSTGIEAYAEHAASYADRVVAAIDALGDRYLRAARMRLTSSDVAALARVLVVGDGVPTKSYENKINTVINMVLGANGHYVPETDSPGVYNGLQMIEASTAYDRHHRPIRTRRDGIPDAAVRLDRLVSGDTMGSRVLSALESF